MMGVKRRGDPAAPTVQPRPGSGNGKTDLAPSPVPVSAASTAWSRFGPYLVASILLLFGYLYYAPGTAYSLSAEAYRTWAFPAFRYSDLIWLYLRDGLDSHPIPYVDYALEYPPLTGLLSWLASWTPDLPAYFTLVYLLLAASTIGAIWSLQRIVGANVWLFAASPALFFYTGHQWDMAAFGVTALSLMALQRHRDGLGIAGLVVATSLKLFPVVFVAALLVERVRDRRYRSAALTAAAFSLGTFAINAPVAFANAAGWSYFFRWNRDRLADSGLWVLWRGVPTGDLTRWSLVAALAGGVAITLLAMRTRGPLFIPLGATYLLWWLLVNKTFTTHLMLWAILGLALLSAPWWLWGLVTAIDVVGFQLGNYLNLYNIPDFHSAPLIRKAVENIYDPVQLARSAILFVAALCGLRILRSPSARATCISPVQTHPAPRNSNTANPWTIASSTVAAPAHRLTGLAAGLGFILSTIAMTWPYPLHLTDATIVGFDPLLQIWLSEWIQHALATHPGSLFQANIFYPFAMTLAYTDANVPGALLAWPLRLATGDPILTNSLLVLASFVLAASGVYALIVYLTGNRGAAFITGLAYAFLPYRMVHLWHLNWLEGGLLPWVILALLQLIDRPSPRKGVVLGLLAALLLLTSFYFSVQVVLVCGIAVATRSIASRQFPPADFLHGLSTAIIVAALLTVPAYLPYLQVREDQQLERTLVDTEQYKALPASYLQIAPWDAPTGVQMMVGVRAGPNESLSEVGQERHADGHQHPEIVSEDALYPGLLALLFAGIGLGYWRTRRWLPIAFALTGIVALALSFGPTWGPKHGDGPSLPYGWLFDHAPLFRSMRVPARLGGLTDLMVVLLAGFGLAFAWERLNHWKRQDRARQAWLGPVLTTLLAFVVLADLWTGSIPIEMIDRGSEASAAARWLASQPPGPVMEFPAESVFADPAAASVRRHYGEAMFRSTLDWNPRVNGNSGFIPRAYSDFIERFVGQIPRPDGSLTPRISHVDADSARLVNQLGVRYLIFHRDQYRQADWPAVAAQLAALTEERVISRVAELGRATIYVLEPMAPGISPPELSVFAPTLITPDSDWSPWVAVSSPNGTPAVLALTKPTRMEAIWYDADGRQLWRGDQHIPLPAVLDDPYLICNAIDCVTSRPLGDGRHLPPPENDGWWYPRTPGHYIVRLHLSGDQSLDCRVDLDLVSDAAEVWKRSRDQAFRWAECIPGHPNPVNNPGAVPFLLSPPSITLVDNSAVVDIAVTPRQDEEVRGWFILAPPGDPEPWNNAVFQSPIQQKLLPASEPTPFEWRATVGPDVPPGVYGLSVWFHRNGPSGWEHAAGGDLQIAPVIVDTDHSLRWAGPIRVRLAERPARFVPGQSATFTLSVSGASERLTCEAAWQLLAGTQVVANGNAGACSRPEIALPWTVPPGHYRLEIDAFARSDDADQLSDAVSISVAVLSPAQHGVPS